MAVLLEPPAVPDSMQQFRVKMKKRVSSDQVDRFVVSLVVTGENNSIIVAHIYLLHQYKTTQNLSHLESLSALLFSGTLDTFIFRNILKQDTTSFINTEFSPFTRIQDTGLISVTVGNFKTLNIIHFFNFFSDLP